MSDNQRRLLEMFAARYPAMDITLNTPIEAIEKDSLGLMGAMFEIETEFECHITSDAMMSFRKVSDIAGYLDQRVP